MQHLIIQGAAHSGKSETINAICHRLNPSRVCRINLRNRTCDEIVWPSRIVNDSYLLEISGRCILVSAGAPTEQQVTIAEIIRIVREVFNVEITFAIVAKRSSERSIGFNTIHELEGLGSECVGIESIRRIANTDSDNIESSPEFIARVDRLYNRIMYCINLPVYQS